MKTTDILKQSLFIFIFVFAAMFVFNWLQSCNKPEISTEPLKRDSVIEVKIDTAFARFERKQDSINRNRDSIASNNKVIINHYNNFNTKKNEILNNPFLDSNTIRRKLRERINARQHETGINP